MDIKRLVVGPIRTNCYILSDNNEAAIIDPGGNPELIIKEFGKTGAKLKYIINTHGHFDHTEANNQIKAAARAPIFIHEKEKEYIDFQADNYLKEGDTVKLGNIELKVINTPGHTKGSICLRGEDFIFTGDTLFRDGVGRTDLPGGSDEELDDSLELLRKVIKPGMHVYPGHGEGFLA